MSKAEQDVENVIYAGAFKPGKSEDLAGAEVETHVLQGWLGGKILDAKDGWCVARQGTAGRERFLDPPANHLGDYLWNGGFAGRPGALVLAIANDSDPVANREYFLEAVRDVDDGKTTIAQTAQDFEKPLGFVGIQGRVRLVHDDDVGLLVEGSGDFDELPLSNCEGADRPRRIEMDAHVRQDLTGFLAHLSLVEHAGRR